MKNETPPDFFRKRFANLAAILADLDAHGVRYRLVGGVFRAAVNDWLDADPQRKVRIDVIRDSLSLYLRWRQGLCLDCGKAGVVRPRRDTLYCSLCYDARVKPVIERLRQTDAQRNRQEKQRDERFTVRKTDNEETDAANFALFGEEGAGL